MSSPEEVRRESENEEDDAKKLNLPSSSQKKTPKSKAFEKKVTSGKANTCHQNCESLFQETSKSENDYHTWRFSDTSRSSSDDVEPAGPSKTVSPVLPGNDSPALIRPVVKEKQTEDIHRIVSEGELAQLAKVQPLIFNFNEQTTIKDCLKMIEKKVAEYDTIKEFTDLEYANRLNEFTYGSKLINREKNRYRDILPYISVSIIDDSTRVPLGQNKDYINASYIRIVNYGEEYLYIAAQGPLPETTEDFWQMILENNANIIAMITREIEGGTIKCHHYWPVSLKKPLELRQFRIFLENYQILECFIIRVFQIVKKSTGTKHFVKQMQFIKWPDHGTPASAEYFIKFVRYVRKSHLTGPLVVHCSAGVGRTGVFLCLDVVFCAIEKNYSFSISNIVAQMREQRYGMIQTKEQYSFCYEVVLEVLQKLFTLG
ncbi:tyrosine-protein phosphatase non-receptor type 20 isoform X3 [Ochotona princeps]|uniref:tyrosine-protein phosphatase non-receptor type 20 isoform X3 n=1 Tax=Ochotona princeps TaxID=9978 RepID=UPI002714F476|nr:tyrosine-protein phosphatase non-receptor type 20 isoform X3 [Ochotona princeps]